MNNTSLKSSLLPGTLIPFIRTAHDIVLHVEDSDDGHAMVTTIYFKDDRIEVSCLVVSSSSERFRDKALMFNVE